MCRQAWFPPGDSARDARALTDYFRQLEKSAGGHGNGAGWMDPTTGKYRVEKALRMSCSEAAQMVAARPRDAWGIFHTRLASAGVRDDRGCHPHVYESQQEDRAKRRLVVLTHNGTWSQWEGACVAVGVKYPNDSACIAALIADRGWKKIAAAIDQTIIAAIREQGAVHVRVWKNHYPLVQLADDGIASEGGTGEFKAVQGLQRGSHDAAKPRTEALEYRFRSPSTSAFADDMESTYKWVKGANGQWVQQPQPRGRDDRDGCLLPGVEEVSEDEDAAQGGEEVQGS